ncbi:MAG: hypothetical protein V1748_05065 [Actinomycetota bacterium]
MVRNLRFVSLRLRSRPETTELARDLDEARVGIQAVTELYAQALEVRVAATAEIEYLDYCLDQAVMNLAREIAVMTKGRPEDPRHTKLFPSAPSELIRPIANEVQGRFVRSLVSRLREDKDYGHLLQHAETIEQAQLGLDSALERRKSLYEPELKAQTDRRIAMDRARALYNTLYHRLTLLYPEHPTLVRSFFLRPSTYRVRPATAPEDDADITDDVGETTRTPE